MSNVLTAARQRYADRIPACGAKIAPDPSFHVMIRSGLFAQVPLLLFPIFFPMKREGESGQSPNDSEN